MVEVVAHDFILRGVAHVPDLRLKVSEDGLKELVFLLKHELVVQDGLHRRVVAQLRVHCQALELVVVLLVVEDGLRDDDVGLDLRLQVGHVGPVLGCLHLEAVQHQLIANVLPHVPDVLLPHPLECFALARLQELNLVLRRLRDLADLRSPLVHVAPLLRFHLSARVLEVLILDQRLHAPVLLTVLPPPRFHVKPVLLPLVLKVIVNLPRHSDPHSETLVRCEKYLS